MTDQDSLNSIGVNLRDSISGINNIVYSLPLSSCFLSSGHWCIFPVNKTAEVWSRQSGVVLINKKTKSPL